MGAYTRALLGYDVQEEGKQFQKRAKKKSLWGSIGRTLGGLGAMALTGGVVNPLTTGLISGGMSFLGGAAGARAAGGKLTGGKFFQADRKSAQTELGAFGTQNLMASLKSGLTAGFGRATKLYGAGSKAKEAGKSAAEVSKIRKGVGFKEGFGESFVGKSKFAQNIRSAKYFKDQGLSEFVDPNLQVGTESGKKIIAMDRRSNIANQLQSPLTREAGGVSLQDPNLLGNVTAPSIAGGERGRDAAETLRIQAQQQEQLDLMSKGKAPGLFRQTREGGAPVLQDESLDAILQRQSDAASVADRRTSVISYGGGGSGIDPNIQSTGNEFIDQQLGGSTTPSANIVSGNTLDDILQRQSNIASVADKRTSIIGYGGGGSGIDTSIQSTGNEFIDRKLGLGAANIYRNKWR